MKFHPKSEDELQALTLLPPGIYKFQVSTATDETSKSGNQMIKLTLAIWGQDNTQHFVFDYLLEQMAFKLRHFCESTNIINLYELGEIHALDCVELVGYAHVEVQKGAEKPDGTSYPSRNIIKDYLKKPVHFAEPLKDDEIPF